MPNYIGDSVVPSFLEVSSNEFYSDGGLANNVTLRMGEIRKILLPSDSLNVSKKFTEYDVLVWETANGTAASKIYNNCGVSCLFGSTADKFVWTPRVDPVLPSLHNGDIVGNGSKVLLLCINSQTTNAIIIGAVRDDKDLSEAKYTTNSNPGHHLLFQFNGIAATVDKDGQLAVTYGGKTNNDGTTPVPAATSGSSVIFSKDGNISIQDRDSKNQILLNHAESKIENIADKEWNASANGSMARIDSNGSITIIANNGSTVFMDAREGSEGIKIIDSTGNNVTLDSDGVAIVDNAGSSVALTGDGTVQVSGQNVVVTGTGIGLSGMVSVGFGADSFMVRGTETVTTLVALNTALSAYIAALTTNIQANLPTLDPGGSLGAALTAACTACTTALTTICLSKGNKVI